MQDMQTVVQMETPADTTAVTTTTTPTTNQMDRGIRAHPHDNLAIGIHIDGHETPDSGDTKAENGTSLSLVHYTVTVSPAFVEYCDREFHEAGQKPARKQKCHKTLEEAKEHTEPLKSHIQDFPNEKTAALSWPIPAVDKPVPVVNAKINDHNYNNNDANQLWDYRIAALSSGKKGDGDLIVNCNAVYDIPKASVDSDKSNILRLESRHREPTATFFQATLNCVSMLFGLGILSSPYAVANAGWMGAIISIMVAMTYTYTAHLMARCVQYHPDCGTYQDMARFVLGKRTRRLIAILFYIEIVGTLVGYCISVGDNLVYIFPHTSFSLPGLSNKNFMIFVASLIILPSVWLRDLSALSFTSVWCIASTILLLISIMLAATINHVGFTHSIPFLKIQGVPVAAGLYAFSYGGTSVFPSIYKSMKDPSKFTQVLLISFSIATTAMVGLGIAGATMFGELTKSQVTLSMPIQFISTKIVLWMTILTPICKFALQLSPLTTAAEAQLYRCCNASETMLFAMGTLTRSCILAFIAILSMVFPYFEYIVALVGSSMTISICMIFPCLFYLKLYWSQLRLVKKTTIITLVAIGMIVGTCGTFVAIQGLIDRRKSHSQ